MNKFLTHQTGEASLLAAIAASVIGLLTVGAIYQGLSNANRSQRLIAGSSDQATLKSQIQGVISNQDLCGSAFLDSSGNRAKFNPNVTLPPNPTQNQIDAFKLANTLSRISISSLVLAQTGTSSGSLDVNSISLVELVKKSTRPTTTMSNAPVTEVISELDVAVTKNPQTGGVGISTVLRFPLFVYVNEGKNYEIVGCSITAQTNGSNSGQTSNVQEFDVPLTDLQKFVPAYKTLTCSNIVQGPRGQGFAGVTFNTLRQYWSNVPADCGSYFSRNIDIQLGCSRYCQQAHKMNSGFAIECLNSATNCYCIDYMEASHFIANTACRRYCKQTQSFSTGVITECNATTTPNRATCSCAK